MINQLQDFQVIIFWPFLTLLDGHSIDNREVGAEREEKARGKGPRVLLKPRPAVLSRMACGRSLNALS